MKIDMFDLFYRLWVIIKKEACFYLFIKNNLFIQCVDFDFLNYSDFYITEGTC